MARRKLDVVRPRITIPTAMWERIEKLAKMMEIDAPTFVRIMICQQTYQWEIQTDRELIATAIGRAVVVNSDPAAYTSLMADIQETSEYGLRGKAD